MTSKPFTASRFLTIADVSAAMSVSIKTVRRWIERGELHLHRIGKVLRISEEDLKAFSASHRS